MRARPLRTGCGATSPRTATRSPCGGCARTAAAWRSGPGPRSATGSARLAAAFTRLGLGRGERMLLFLRNRPEFHVADLGALLAGGTPLSIYNSSAPEQVAQLAGHSRSRIAVVEDIEFLERLLKVRDELPDLRAVVVVDDPDGLRPADVHLLADLLRGRAGRPRRRGGRGPPRRPGHGHLHLRHDRPAQGRDAHQRQRPGAVRRLHGAGRVDARTGARCPTCRWRTSPSGWSPTTAGCGSARGHLLPGPEPRWSRTWSRSGRPTCSGRRGCSRSSRPASRPRSPRPGRRRRPGSSEALAVGRQVAELRRADQAAAAGAGRGLGAGRRRRCSRRCAATVGLDAAALLLLRRRPAAGRRHALPALHRPPVLRGVRDEREHRRMTWEPYRVKPGTVGRRCPGSRSASPRTARCWPAARSSSPGYLDDPERTRRDLRRRRLAAHRRHRRVRRRRLPVASSTARRS